MKIIKKYIFLLLLWIVMPIVSLAQCNEYSKKECLPLLKPFTFSGQLNNAVMSQGETAELQLTFYKDQEYRLLVKGEDNLGKIQYQMYDTDYNLLYDSASEEFPIFWDFMVENTDDFIIRVIIPEGYSPKNIESGCVAILVGFRAFGTRTFFK